MTVSHGKPYAGNPHVRFDEGADVPDEGRSALLHQLDGDVFNTEAQRHREIGFFYLVCSVITLHFSNIHFTKWVKTKF